MVHSARTNVPIITAIAAVKAITFNVFIDLILARFFHTVKQKRKKF
jgi:hypothetical protein